MVTAAIIFYTKQALTFLKEWFIPLLLIGGTVWLLGAMAIAAVVLVTMLTVRKKKKRCAEAAAKTEETRNS